MSTLPTAVALELDALGEAMLVALVAGLTVTLAVSLVIFGASRYGELRRSGRGGAALAAAGLAAVSSAVAVGIVIAGLVAMAI